jgi:hypothetical protein
MRDPGTHISHDTRRFVTENQGCLEGEITVATVKIVVH